MGIEMDDRLYPVSVYEYDRGGNYSWPPPLLKTEGEVERWFKESAPKIMAERREARLCDPMDFCVFHCAEGRVLFPPA